MYYAAPYKILIPVLLIIFKLFQDIFVSAFI